jgi:hypothetical protein
MVPNRWQGSASTDRAEKLRFSVRSQSSSPSGGIEEFGGGPSRPTTSREFRRLAKHSLNLKSGNTPRSHFSTRGQFNQRVFNTINVRLTLPVAVVYVAFAAGLDWTAGTGGNADVRRRPAARRVPPGARIHRSGANRPQWCPRAAARERSDRLKKALTRGVRGKRR